ncbi:hypothetical protein TMEC54S_03753 [Thauera mechernichensis]
MNQDWQGLSPEDELERADDLLNQADALLKRHQAKDDAGGMDWYPTPELDEDDLPILTEVVEDFALPPDWPATSAPHATGFERPPTPPPKAHASSVQAPPSAGADHSAALQAALSSRLAEKLVELDTEIAREIGLWVSNEMPQILSRELDGLASRLQAEMQAHLRATLLPELSARVGRLLDDAGAPQAVQPPSRT